MAIICINHIDVLRKILSQVGEKDTLERSHISKARLPGKRTLCSSFRSVDGAYTGSISIISPNPGDFNEFYENVKKNLKYSVTPWIISPIDPPDYFGFKRQGDDLNFSYGLMKENERMLSLLMGRDLLSPRRAFDEEESDEQEFDTTIFEFQNLATICFQEFLKIPGTPKDFQVFI